MGRLRISAIEYNYKEIGRQLTKQFIHILNDDDMMVEIIKEFTKSEENKDVASNQVLLWERQVEAQGTQTTVLNSLKVNQKFDNILFEKQKNTSINYNRAKQACVNTADPTTHLEDAQCMGRDVGNAAR